MFARLRTLILLLWRNKTSTEGTRWILALVFLTILRPPVIYQVFIHERLATIGATWIDAIAVTLGMIGLALAYVKLGIVYRLMAGSADKMLWMPCCPQS